jgi:heat shock protein HslJ
MKKSMVAITIMACLLLLSACYSWGSETTDANLTTPLWALSTIMNKELVPGSGITTQFTSDGKISGSAGCNQYSGTYTISGTSMQISSTLSSTRMACAQEIMDQETAYLKALGEVKMYTVSETELLLSDANNKSILVYKPQPQDLVGSAWEVIGYNNGKQAVISVLTGTTLTIKFDKDGNVSGNAGCNTFSGAYTLTGNQIKIGPLASTLMACSDPAGIMDQESQFLTALQSAATYQIEGMVLELRNSDGALAVDASTYVPPAMEANPIQGILWQWVSVTNQSTGAKDTVPSPENYAITFNADGTFEGKADCNLINGTYAQDNGFIITLGASTMAYCGAASLDTQFLSLLENVVAGGSDGAGGLALETAGGAQRMMFKSSGPVK